MSRKTLAIRIAYVILLAATVLLAYYAGHRDGQADPDRTYWQPVRTPHWPVQKAEPCPKGFHLHKGECDSDSPPAPEKEPAKWDGLREIQQGPPGWSSCAAINNTSNEYAAVSDDGFFSGTYKDDGAVNFLSRIPDTAKDLQGGAAARPALADLEKMADSTHRAASRLIITCYVNH